VLFTVPNQLGVEYNARLLETIVRHVAPAIGWSGAPADGADSVDKPDRARDADGSVGAGFVRTDDVSWTES
jgi:hypothetical protein